MLLNYEMGCLWKIELSAQDTPQEGQVAVSQGYCKRVFSVVEELCAGLSFQGVTASSPWLCPLFSSHFKHLSSSRQTPNKTWEISSWLMTDGQDNGSKYFQCFLKVTSNFWKMRALATLSSRAHEYKRHRCWTSSCFGEETLYLFSIPDLTPLCSS